METIQIVGFIFFLISCGLAYSLYRVQEKELDLIIKDKNDSKYDKELDKIVKLKIFVAVIYCLTLFFSIGCFLNY